jgi:uncharacterized protein
MRVVVDSSSFAKRYIQEIGSDRLDDLLQDVSELGLSIILLPEIISGLNRRLREQFVNDTVYRDIKNRLLYDISDATILQITPGVITHSVKLLENNVLRAMDALHVACALEWKADLFITSDKRQLEAAINSELQCEYIG